MTHDSIDLDLVDKTVALVPEHGWTQVRQAIVTTLVDNMPASVIEQLTGTYHNFDEAEEILYGYYELPEYQNELIVDAFKIMGATSCLELLSSLKFNEDELQTVQQQ